MKKIYSIIIATILASVSSAFMAYAYSPEMEAVAPADNIPTMKVTAMGIELCAPGDTPALFHIYSITGQMIKTVTVDSTPMTIELYKGCYIVKCAQWAKQIVVR